MSENTPNTTNPAIDWEAVSSILGQGEQDLRFTIPTPDQVQGFGTEPALPTPIAETEAPAPLLLPEVATPDNPPKSSSQPEDQYQGLPLSVDQPLMTTIEDLMNRGDAPQPRPASAPGVSPVDKIKAQFSEKTADIRRGWAKNKELQQKKAELNDVGKSHSGLTKQLAGMVGEDKPIKSINDFLPHLETEQDNGEPLTNDNIDGIIRDRFSRATPEERNKLIEAYGGDNRKESTTKAQLAFELKQQLEKAREALKKIPSSESEYDSLMADVESYKELEAKVDNIEANLNQRSKIGRKIGKAALLTTMAGAAIKEGWNYVRAHDLRTKGMEQVTKSKKRTYVFIGGVALIGVAAAFGVTAVILDQMNGPETGTITADIAASPSPTEDPTGLGDPSPSPSGENPLTPEPSDEISPTETPESPAAEDPASSDETNTDANESETEDFSAEENATAEQLDPNEKTTTESLSGYSGNLDSTTGLMEGTATNSTAHTVIDMGVDFDSLQNDPDFQKDLHNLTTESLEADGIDVDAGEDRQLSNDYEVKIPNDQLQDFLDKWGPETEVEAPAENDNPPLNVETSQEAPEPQMEQIAAEAANNQEILIGDTSLDQAINEVAKQIPELSPELALSFKNMLMSDSNMIAELYSGTSISPQEAQTYSNLHNSLIVPPLEYGYEQFAANMQRLIADFISSSSNTSKA